MTKRNGSGHHKSSWMIRVRQIGGLRDISYPRYMKRVQEHKVLGMNKKTAHIALTCTMLEMIALLFIMSNFSVNAWISPWFIINNKYWVNISLREHLNTHHTVSQSMCDQSLTRPDQLEAILLFLPIFWNLHYPLGSCKVTLHVFNKPNFIPLWQACSQCPKFNLG